MQIHNNKIGSIHKAVKLKHNNVTMTYASDNIHYKNKWILVKREAEKISKSHPSIHSFNTSFRIYDCGKPQ